MYNLVKEEYDSNIDDIIASVIICNRWDRW